MQLGKAHTEPLYIGVYDDVCSQRCVVCLCLCLWMCSCICLVCVCDCVGCGVEKYMCISLGGVRVCL